MKFCCQSRQAVPTAKESRSLMSILSASLCNGRDWILSVEMEALQKASFRFNTFGMSIISRGNVPRALRTLNQVPAISIKLNKSKHRTAWKFGQILQWEIWNISDIVCSISWYSPFILTKIWAEKFTPSAWRSVQFQSCSFENQARPILGRKRNCKDDEQFQSFLVVYCDTYWCI